MKPRSSSRYFTGGLTLWLALACLSPALSQTKKHPVSIPSVPPTGIPQADSLKKYEALLDHGDSSSLAKVWAASHPGALASPRSAQIFVLSRALGDSIVLRWGPSTPGGWASTNKTGFMISRGTVRKDGTVDKGSIIVLTGAPLRPWSMTEWASRAEHSDKWAAVAAGALHAKSFVPEIQQKSETGQIKAAVDELLARYAYAMLAADNDPIAANGLALRYVDRTAERGKQYVYSVRPAKKDTAYTVAEGGAVASPGESLPNPPPPNFQAESLDRLVILRWSQGIPGAQYGGFYISRSEDAGVTYHRMNSNLFLPGGQSIESNEAAYPDSAVVNYHHYRYRVQGVTPFGDLSEPAEAEAVPRDFTPPPAPIAQRPIDLGRRGLKLVWEMPSSPPDLRGFLVMRSGFWQTGYHAAQEHAITTTPITDDESFATALQHHLIGAAAREYTDTLTSLNEPFYIIAAVDTSGNISRSLPVYSERIDTLPPSIPVGLTGTMDTLGKVLLHWRPGPEPNLLGYRVYWSNSPVDTFAVRVGQVIPDTTFIDSVAIHTLTRKVFYRIAAVNRRYIPSKFSPILAITRPDVVPPASPIFKSVIVTDSSVILVWAPSPSADVKMHQLLRRSLSDSAWKAVRTFGQKDSAFVDVNVIPRVVYDYAIEAIDSSGLHSAPSTPVQARPYDTGIRPNVKGLRATYQEAVKEITVSWSYVPARKERFWFVVYRAVGDRGLTEYKAIDGSVRSFKDSPDTGKGTYRYALKVATEVGGQPPLSEPVAVDIH